MTSTVTSNHADTVTLDRRVDRRKDAFAANFPRQSRQELKPQRRRHIDPTTCERDYRKDELDFMRAMDDYKCSSGRMFPTCSEVLEVVRAMGYVRLNPEQVELLGETIERVAEPFATGHDAESDLDFDFDQED